LKDKESARVHVFAVRHKMITKQMAGNLAGVEDVVGLFGQSLVDAQDNECDLDSISGYS
jgi:hypothetical protein